MSPGPRGAIARPRPLHSVTRVRCLRLCLATAGVGVAVAAVALAQDTVPIELHVDARVVPNKAGTAKHPQAVRIESHAYIKIPEGYDPPLVDTVEVWFPKGGLYNGRKYRSARTTCSRASGRVP
jgi:hypothetical protein